MMKKAIVFIDGSNFYHRLKDLKLAHSLLDFNFREFSKWLTRGDQLVGIRHYVGAVRRESKNSKSEELYANQQKLIGKLQQQEIDVIMGQIIRHPDGTRHEKGVDVRIAVETIRLARESKYETAYLVSSDTDLVPAVEEVQSLKKEVRYVGFVKGQSFGLSKTTGDYLILRVEDVEKFFPKKLI